MVVGPAGHLIAVERMDEAGFITPETAIAKAFTLAAFRSMSPLTCENCLGISELQIED